MEYQYKCRITAWDFFRLTMRQTYRSMAGMCNLVFTVAMFPVIQPAAIYAKARRQAAAVPQDVRLTFDEKGLLVTTGGERQHLPWNRLRVTKQPGMVLVLSGAGSGYMLTNRVLGADREAFWSFVQSKVEQNR